MTIVIISIIASISALLGGIIALRMRDQLHLILGFSAGAIVGAALLDLIPEAVHMSAAIGLDVDGVTALTAVGFLAYLSLDRFVFGHSEERGTLGAGSLSVHSLIDGAAIGLAFQASEAAGFIIAIAVIAHRFSDGINVVGVIFRHGGDKRKALKWLSGVVVAPIVGAVATLLISVPEQTLGPMLAVFAGFFIYIGASDLIPEGNHGHPKTLTTVMTIFGAVLLYVIVRMAH